MNPFSILMSAIQYGPAIIAAVQTAERMGAPIIAVTEKHWPILEEIATDYGVAVAEFYKDEIQSGRIKTDLPAVIQGIRDIIASLPAGSLGELAQGLASKK